MRATTVTTGDLSLGEICPVTTGDLYFGESYLVTTGDLYFGEIYPVTTGDLYFGEIYAVTTGDRYFGEIYPVTTGDRYNCTLASAAGRPSRVAVCHAERGRGQDDRAWGAGAVRHSHVYKEVRSSM